MKKNKTDFPFSNNLKVNVTRNLPSPVWKVSIAERGQTPGAVMATLAT